MSKLLKYLMALKGLLVLNVVDGDDGGVDDADLNVGDDSGTDTGDGDDGSVDDGDDSGDGDGTDDGMDASGGSEPPAQRRQPSRLERDMAEARRRAQEAEERAARAEEAARQAAQHAAGPSAEQMEWQKEEAILKDPDADPNLKWQIQSNRIIRQNAAASQAALAEARDTKDSAEYERICAKDRTADAYRQRVEDEIAKIRRSGQPVPPRSEMYALLVGRDIRDGKFKAAAPTKPKIPTSKRGNGSGIRSDVSGRERLNDSQKREKRLEGRLL